MVVQIEMLLNKISNVLINITVEVDNTTEEDKTLDNDLKAGNPLLKA